MVTGVVRSPPISNRRYERVVTAISRTNQSQSPPGGGVVRPSLRFSIFLGGVAHAIRRHVVPVIRDVTRLAVDFLVTYG